MKSTTSINCDTGVRVEEYASIACLGCTGVGQPNSSGSQTVDEYLSSLVFHQIEIKEPVRQSRYGNIFNYASFCYECCTRAQFD